MSDKDRLIAFLDGAKIEYGDQNVRPHTKRSAHFSLREAKEPRSYREVYISSEWGGATFKFDEKGAFVRFDGHGE